MKIKTSELTGAALDWAVCDIAGVFRAYPRTKKNFKKMRERGTSYLLPSISWAMGGPIIEQEGISLIRQTATRWVSEYSNGCERIDHGRSWGPTSLIAAMRCYVASKLGDEVDVPEELL